MKLKTIPAVTGVLLALLACLDASAADFQMKVYAPGIKPSPSATLGGSNAFGAGVVGQTSGPVLLTLTNSATHEDNDDPSSFELLTDGRLVPKIHKVLPLKLLAFKAYLRDNGISQLSLCFCPCLLKTTKIRLQLSNALLS